VGVFRAHTSHALQHATLFCFGFRGAPQSGRGDSSPYGIRAIRASKCTAHGNEAHHFSRHFPQTLEGKILGETPQRMVTLTGAQSFCANRNVPFELVASGSDQNATQGMGPDKVLLKLVKGCSAVSWAQKTYDGTQKQFLPAWALPANSHATGARCIVYPRKCAFVQNAWSGKRARFRFSPSGAWNLITGDVCSASAWLAARVRGRGHTWLQQQQTCFYSLVQLINPKYQQVGARPGRKRLTINQLRSEAPYEGPRSTLPIPPTLTWMRLCLYYG